MRIGASILWLVLASACAGNAERVGWREMEPLPVDAGFAWIEEGEGPRQAGWDAWRVTGRYEFQLHTPGGDAPWGTLVLPTDPYEGRWGNEVADRGDELRLLVHVVRELAVAAGESAADISSPIGPVVVFGKPMREPSALRARIDDVAWATAGCIGTAAMADVVRRELPRDAEREARMGSLVREVLAAVRLTARRLAELTAPAARTVVPDAAGDAPCLDALRSATRSAASATADWNALAVAAATLTARDMSFRYVRVMDPMFGLPADGEPVFGRTHVVFDGDAVSIVEIELGPEAQSRESGPVRYTRLATVPRDALTGAQMIASEGRKWPNVEVRDDCSIEIRDVVGRGRLVADSTMLFLPVHEVVIHCDSPAHRQELLEELRRFSAGPR